MTGVCARPPRADPPPSPTLRERSRAPTPHPRLRHGRPRPPPRGLRWQLARLVPRGRRAPRLGRRRRARLSVELDRRVSTFECTNGVKSVAGKNWMVPAVTDEKVVAKLLDAGGINLC